jgi:Fe-S cluster assembly protein SufD
VKSSILSLEALQAAVGRLPDDRLAPMRQKALEQLGETGLPTTRHEDWKYTDLSAIVELSNQWLSAPAVGPGADATAALVDSVCGQVEAHWLVIADGEVNAESLARCRDAGVSASLLSEAEVGLESSFPLTQLNTALLKDGIALKIDADQALDRPIGLLVLDQPAEAGGVSQARIEIRMAPNSRARFIEYHVSRGDAQHYHNSVVSLEVGDGAEVDYVRIQDRHRDHAQTGRLNARLGRDSRFAHCGFDLGGVFVRNDLDISIDGPGAAAAFDGLYLGGQDQHIDNHTRIDHRVGPAQSRQEYRGIAAANARCIWNGKAIVHVGADGTDAAQANHNLLLSDHAEVDAKPELEIYADDVKCSHGTTVGQLDEQALYYLRTRGLDKRYAQRVLTRAFAQAVVSRTPVTAVESLLTGLIEDRLGRMLESLPR